MRESYAHCPRLNQTEDRLHLAFKLVNVSFHSLTCGSAEMHPGSQNIREPGLSTNSAFLLFFFLKLAGNTKAGKSALYNVAQ